MRRTWAGFALAALAWAAVLYACSNAVPSATRGTTDAAVVDGSRDVAADADASPSEDAAIDTGPCGPRDAAGFSPTWPSRWRPPAPFGQTVCQLAQIQTYVTACLGAGNPDPHLCTATLDASASDLACYECIFPDELDAAPGPLVSRDCGILVNLAGCLANATGDPDAAGCVGAWLSADECTATACASCTCGDGLTDERTPCVQAASEAGCAAWQSAASCVAAFADASPDASVAAECVTVPTTTDELYATIALFCGGAP
jgi:hypothetical protein